MRFAFLRYPNSLAGKILLTCAIASLFMVSFAGAVLYAVLSWQKGPYLWEGLRSDAHDIERSMRFDRQGVAASLTLPSWLEQQYDGLRKDLAFRVVDENGTEVFSSGTGPALSALRRADMSDARKVLMVETRDSALRVWQKKVVSSSHTYSIHVARSQRLASILRAGGQRLVVSVALLSTLVVLLIFVCFVLRTTRRIAQHLREVSEAAAAVEPGNLTQRLDGRQLPSELMPLISAFNNALERLENGYRVQQELLASVAHELKTPLALIRAEIEMEASPNRGVLLKDVDIMARQVHQLLQLAEVSEVQNYTFERLDLCEIVRDVVAFSTRLSQPKSVDVHMVYHSDPVMVTADRGAIFTLAKNLVENAIYHSPPGERVMIELGNSGFSIRDNGPGVMENDVAKLFSRFWRSALSRYEGAGLGLSICKVITTAHRWKIDYLPAGGGQGAEFHVLFSDDPQRLDALVAHETRKAKSQRR